MGSQERKAHSPGEKISSRESKMAGGLREIQSNKIRDLGKTSGLA